MLRLQLGQNKCRVRSFSESQESIVISVWNTLTSSDGSLALADVILHPHPLQYSSNGKTALTSAYELMISEIA
jgi:hypothetical protein